MIIASKIHMDLQHPGTPQIVHAVQADCYCRHLEISLYSGKEPWALPAGVSVLIRYRRGDRAGGKYNLLPDGTSAWHSEENVLTVALAPEVLADAGIVLLDVLIHRGEERISTFPILVKVDPAVGGGSDAGNLSSAALDHLVLA